MFSFRRSVVFFAGSLLAGFAPATAHAHSLAQTMTIASTADGSGQLVLEYDFTSVARVSYSTMLAGTDVYEGILPAFEEIAADDIGESHYALDAGTEVSIVITAINVGRSAVQVGATLLDSVGDAAVIGTSPIPHTHPAWQLLLADGDRGEASISFKLTATGPASYGESPVYTVKLTNGVVAPFDFDVAVYDSAAVACQSAIAKALPRLVSRTMVTLQRCLVAATALQAAEALAIAPANLAELHISTEATCAGAVGADPAKTPIGKIEALRSAAELAIVGKCAGFVDATAAHDHVKLASCRTEELLGAAYPGSRLVLAEFVATPAQGADPLSDHFPCLFETVGE